MFELDIEMLKEQGLQLVDSAKKTAQDLADKGKNKLDLLNQQARLSKAQRQLGALVYSLHKAGEENPALVEKYIDAVAEVEKAIEEIKANMTDDERAEVEAQEAAENTESEAAPEEEAAPAEDEEIEEEPIQLRGETKICPVCKAEVDGDALFCNHCGAQL
ncbi:zinc ribbon domain-containing protein [uncultured Gemmiger sp.]|uniref:zinc ribbon domain-containing protein n=1 Tax=uncultured Gemmiger sp. TaxID=1623490 RepID=UPI0025FB7605|nr:zinc ribbon domain-containing protein [uncultured Gemmiger sp.]